MCIRSTLLYRCYPSVYSPVHSSFLFSLVVDRGWGGVVGGGMGGVLRGRSLMGTSHAHWQTINNNNNNEKSNKKNTSCALWETDLPHHQRQTSIHTRQLRSTQTFSFLFSIYFLHLPHKATRSCSCSDLRRQRPSAVDVHCKELFLFFLFFFALLTRKRPRRPNPRLASSFSPLLRLFSKSRRTLDFVLRDVCRLAKKGCCVFTLEGVGEWLGEVRGRGHHGAQYYLNGKPRFNRSVFFFFLSFFLSSTFSVFDIEFF